MQEINFEKLNESLKIEQFLQYLEDNILGKNVSHLAGLNIVLSRLIPYLLRVISVQKLAKQPAALGVIFATFFYLQSRA